MLETPEKKLVEEKVGPLAEPNAFPVSGPDDADVTEQPMKVKVSKCCFKYVRLTNPF